MATAVVAESSYDPRCDTVAALDAAIDQALTTGQLGWTKVRLVCRVATPESEAHWLAVAGRLSAAADFELLPARALPAAAPATPSPFVEALVAGLEEAGARELDQRLCRAAALEQGLLARIGPLLLAFANLRGPYKLGFRSFDAYVREQLGMSPRKARALLRLERACALAPELGDAWREGRTAHHHRSVHGGVIRISGRAPRSLVFEMPLARFRSGDRAVRA